jgi:hypothetical protein
MAQRDFLRIKNLLKVNKLLQDKQVIVFLICLVIAASLWFLNALSKDYETTLTYPVHYTNVPEKRFLANNPPGKIDIDVRAHGFVLLRNTLNLSFAPVILDITRLIPHAEETEPLSYTIRTSDLLNRISSQISNEITILEVHPGSIVLILDSLETKQVPVEADIQIDFAEQYNLSAPLQIIPEQVLATGPGSLLDTLESVSTVHKTFRAIKKTTEEELELVAPEKVTLKPRKAKVIIPAEEFTEKILKIPVKILDKPNDTDIKLFPSELEVSFRVALSQYTAINATDFLLAIPFSAIRSGHPNVQVTLEKKPDFVRDIKYFPQTIEYLIEKE